MPKVKDGGTNNVMYATGYSMLNTANKDAASTLS